MYYLVAVSLLFTVLLTIGIVSAGVFSIVGRSVNVYSERISAQTRVSVLFWLRVLPVVIAAVVIFAFVLPAFLMYEPHQPQETVGIKLAAVIVIAMAGLLLALFRVFGSWWRTRRLSAEWNRNAIPMSMDGIRIPVYRLRHSFPVFAVVGVMRPRVFIADQIFETLDANEIEAVIEHEIGHTSAHHNLKRLLMQLASDVLVAPVGRFLDRTWSEAAEEAADEFAAAKGGRRAAVDLAAALIKIARIIPDKLPPSLPAVSYAFNGESLSARVRRLLLLADKDTLRTRSLRGTTLFLALIVVPLVAILASDHVFLARIHDTSEAVLSFLQ